MHMALFPPLVADFLLILTGVISIVALVAAGGIRSANADISNDKAGEKPARRKTKGSCPTLIGAG